MKMKKLMLSGVAALSVLTLAACSQTASGGKGDAGSEGKPHAGQTLVVTTFGGDWEAAFVDAVVKPFEEETGAKVEMITLYSADALAQVSAQASSPQIDVVHFSGGQEFTAAQEGLIEAIEPSELSNYDDLVEVAVAGLERGEGPAMQMAPIGLVFNTESGAPRPTSWLDVFDDAYAEHLAITDFTNTFGLIAMLRMAETQGNSLEKPDATISELAKLVSSGDAIAVPTSPDVQSAFAQRNVWLAPYAMDYAGTLKDAGLPVEFIVPKEGAGASIHTTNVVSGRDNIELSKLFVDYELRPEAQQVFAERMRYSPVNVKTELSGDIADEVLTGDELDDVITYAPGEIATKRAAWTDLWNSLVTQ